MTGPPRFRLELRGAELVCYAEPSEPGAELARVAAAAGAAVVFTPPCLCRMDNHG